MHVGFKQSNAEQRASLTPIFLTVHGYIHYLTGCDADGATARNALPSHVLGDELGRLTAHSGMC